MVAADALRIVFFGTPAFAVPSLEALRASRHRVVAVVTQPDRPRGRGQKTSEAPVKARALAAGIPVLQPDRMNDPDFVASLADIGPDLGVVAAYGKILTEKVLAAPRLGVVNVHASLLPRYRGAAPVHRAVINGERETGVTIIRVVKELDAGPMLAAEARRIGEDETSEDVDHDLARMGATLLVSTVDKLADGRVHETPQNEAQATYAPRLTKDEGLIDWTQTAEQVHNLVRGLYPWPHAYTFWNGQRLIVLRARAEPGPASPPPGTVCEADGDRLVVACGQGVAAILEILPEGKRPMGIREFLAGHHVAPGVRFDSGP